MIAILIKLNLCRESLDEINDAVQTYGLEFLGLCVASCYKIVIVGMI
jgi:hypothetical protein